MATLAHHLHRLRQKPDHVKRHIAVWTSLGVTLVIVAFWVASLSVSSRASAASSSVAAQSPWHAMTASVSDAWGSFLSSVGASSAQYQAPLQVTPGKQ